MHIGVGVHSACKYLVCFHLSRRLLQNEHRKQTSILSGNLKNVLFFFDHPISDILILVFAIFQIYSKV